MLLKTVSLRPHQVDAIKRLDESNGNMLFAHDVGSGKTLTAIAGFEKLRSEGKAAHTLIVTPAALRDNFGQNGIKKFTDDKYVIFGNKGENSSKLSKEFVDPASYSAGSSKVTHHIVSYDMFKKDPEKYIKAAGADTVIYDEIHRAKNEGVKVTEMIKAARPFHKNFIGLTGSIVSNTPADIVPLVDAMTNGNHILGNKATFENRFLDIDKRGNKSVRDPHVVKKLVAPYIHHVGLEDLNIAPPPAKKVNVVDVPMSGYQTELYKYTLNKLDPITRAKLQSNLGDISDKGLRSIFGKLTAARQVSNAIHTIDPSMSLSESAEQSPKIKKLLDDVEEHLKNTPDAQVLVTTNLIHGGVDVLEQGMKDRKLSFGKFIGKGNAGINETSRQRGVQDYNKGKKKILIISSAGGEGLDLPNTTMIASLDGHYNPEHINQMEARGIRAGGQSQRPLKDRQVIVNRYIATPKRTLWENTSNIVKAFSPQTYYDRARSNEPIWQNPLGRASSLDSTIYDIAARKAKANQELKGLFNKTSEAHVISKAQNIMNKLAELPIAAIDDVATMSAKLLKTKNTPTGATVKQQLSKTAYIMSKVAEFPVALIDDAAILSLRAYHELKAKQLTAKIERNHKRRAVKKFLKKHADFHLPAPLLDKIIGGAHKVKALAKKYDDKFNKHMYNKTEKFLIRNPAMRPIVEKYVKGWESAAKERKAIFGPTDPFMIKYVGGATTALTAGLATGTLDPHIPTILATAPVVKGIMLAEGGVGAATAAAKRLINKPGFKRSVQRLIEAHKALPR